MKRRRWSNPAVRAALTAQRRSTEAWEALTADERKVRWREVRRKQRAGMPSYRAWLYWGCRTPERESS